MRGFYDSATQRTLNGIGFHSFQSHWGSVVARAYRIFASLLLLLFVLVAVSLSGSLQIRALAQESALILCGVLCVFGFQIRRRAAREALGKEEAERALERERRALERRIEDRTRELRMEVEERRRAEEFNRGQKQVLEMLASRANRPTEEILLHLTATLAAQRRTWECALHLLNREDQMLHLAASSEVSERLGRYLATIVRDFLDAPESKACVLGEAHVIEDMRDVRRPWSEFLIANGIFSAWSVPFRASESSEVVGTLTIYSRLQGAPLPRELEMSETAARLAVLVIEHRRIHAELVNNAYQDALTGLPNRRAGEQALETAVQQSRSSGEPFAVLWIDLDRFKRVNDQHGHSAGDHVLCTVAERLRQNPNVIGTAARMGGDEFLVLLAGAAASARAPEIAQQLLGEISQPMRLGNRTFSISASIGICTYPRDGNAIELLERNADAAMYRAKAEGSGSCIYSPAMSTEVQQSIELEEALSVAIDNNFLRVFYQPVYAAAGALRGFEALLRFTHPNLGDIPPSRFIPLAEKTRRIISIGSWALREVCRQLKTWQTAGLPWVRMSVNISAIQFMRDDFAETVAGTLAEFGISAERLTLELTESVLMEDRPAVIRQMGLLKSLGVRIAMDDFGTGYSSLSYLHQLPIDVLKIDRSFVERLQDADGTRPIVEAIISMARHLGLTVVAEGVETQQQYAILRQAGCDAVQGFLFARPMPPQKAEEYLTAHQAPVHPPGARLSADACEMAS